MSDPQKTSWGSVAGWYSDHVESKGTYHSDVLLPHVLKTCESFLRADSSVLEIGCGNGFFSRALSARGYSVTGTDIAEELIEEARALSKNPVQFFVQNAENLSKISSSSFDCVLAVLCLQNMRNTPRVFSEVRRVLKTGGVFFCILNHPAFRVPKKSSWGFDTATQTQFRRIDGYAQSFESEMLMHPGKKNSEVTYTFHKPISFFVNELADQKLCVTRMDEILSHKTSVGKRATTENASRKEIPLFLSILTKKMQ